jgi:hypothetical protein
VVEVMGKGKGKLDGERATEGRLFVKTATSRWIALGMAGG